MLTLRDYQQDLVSQAMTAWSNGMRSLLLQLSTGGGKTVIFAAIAREFVSKFEGVLVVAHREELILQAASKLQTATGIVPGIIKAGYKPVDSLVQVGSIQTLARRKNYPSSKLVIVDEAHHASATSYRNLLSAYPESLILGVTATPRREDGYGLRDVFDELICSISTKKLIALGYLTDYKLIAGFKYSQHKVPKKRDFTTKELAEVAQDYKPEEVLRQWNKFCYGQKTIIFAVNVAHSKAIASQFQSAGMACEHLDGETPQDERRGILDRFRSGETQIITNCAILTEGFDCPDSEAAIIARPTTSVTLWLQMIGRVLRPAPNKSHATIIDMTDNWFRLGRPCENREWSLDPVSCDPETIGTRCCPSCHHVFKPMPAMIRTTEFFNIKSSEFVTTYETDCANCGKSFRWVLEEGRQIEGDRAPVIISTDAIEWQEVPPTVRSSLLLPIIEFKNRKSRKKSNTFRVRMDTLKDWVFNHQDVNLDEIKYGIYLLEMQSFESQILSALMMNMIRAMREVKDWDGITRLMSSRSPDVKKAAWELIDIAEKKRLNGLKEEHMLIKSIQDKQEKSLLTIEETYENPSIFVGHTVVVKKLDGSVKFIGELTSYDSINGNVTISTQYGSRIAQVRETFVYLP